MGPQTRHSGFTLIELMISIVIFAILATLAGPSFVRYIADVRLRSASYDVAGALQFARSEAIKRNSPSTTVDVKRPAGASNWSSGWTIQVGSTVLRSQDAYSHVAITDSANLSTISFANDGRVTSSTTFKVAPATTTSSVTNRCVTISLAGMASSKLGGC